MSQLTEITKELLEAMGFEDPRIQEQRLGDRTKIDIGLFDARVLIGERGATLAMFQHILRRITAKKLNMPASPQIGPAQKNDPLAPVYDESPVFLGESTAPIIDVDINGYKSMREDVLRDFARDIAQRVRTNKKAVELDPMPPFDRRIIHLALATFPDLATESIGEGPARYIVVRPYP